MRILYLTNGFPYPLTSGYLRHYFLIKELARQHAVTLLAIVGAQFMPEHRAALEPFTEQVFTFTSARQSKSLSRKLVSRAQSFMPGAHGNSAAQQMGTTLRELMRRSPFDAVIFSGKDTYPALHHAPGLPLIVDMCDATSLRLRLSWSYTPALRWPLLWWNYRRVQSIERSLMQSAAHMVFATWRDSEALLGPAAARATVIPNGVDTDHWKRTTRELGRNTLLFTGAMSYPPNLDAALYLAEDIFPYVQRALPQVQLLIVGRDPPPRLLRAGEQPGVTVTGYVDDLRTYLERASLFVAPLRFGAGIQNKMLEAMAMEVPVIASPLAADGLRTAEGEAPPVQVARDRDQFVQLICERWSAQAECPAPDIQAREFVMRHFVWQRSGKQLEHVIRTAVSADAQGLRDSAGLAPGTPIGR
jgi:glycosyltransferase involved in cell wall biosynthesis